MGLRRSVGQFTPSERCRFTERVGDPQLRVRCCTPSPMRTTDLPGLPIGLSPDPLSG